MRELAPAIIDGRQRCGFARQSFLRAGFMVARLSWSAERGGSLA
jgi:hypothetical protein